MASVRESHSAFAPQLPHWSQMEHRIAGDSSDPNRPPVVHAEPLRPIEPGGSQSINGHYLNSRPREDPQLSQRSQQLPGVHELLSPSVRTGARLSTSNSWAPINNPPTWRERLLSTSSSSTHSIPHAAPTVSSIAPPPPYRNHMENTTSDSYRQPISNLSHGSSGQRPSSMTVVPLRQPELSSPISHGRQEYPSRGVEYYSPPSYHTLSHVTHHEGHPEHMLDRRPSSVLGGRPGQPGTLFNMQIVGQRDIPGEGLCYVFKDGSTCPTVIDGEPVNPLWGTTKAGKARKRLAQACLNCREKKIKCEPGETSCLQCEKAKRECQRPTVAQSQAEMATGAALSMSANSPERGEWKSHPSPTSMGTIDIPAPKRRRSAHVAQQESSFVQSQSGASSPHHEPKRRRSDLSTTFPSKPLLERIRKDSKRTLLDEEDLTVAINSVSSPDVMAQCDDPFQVEPDGTMLFLDLFFSQSARETHILFPRYAFTHWVKTCNTKCQRESMVLYAVLALGSAFSSNEFSTFARICIERATSAAANLYGRFSMALIQTRLLLGCYSHLKGKDGLAWDYNGSALRAIGAMRLNTEEGCGEDLNEYARPYYNLNHEQLRECRRRTFWAAFLMDRYNGFCSGLLSTIQEDDIQLRLPCTEHAYEEGCASTAPYFDSLSVTSGDSHSPAAYTITVSVLWKEVAQFVHRSEHFAPSSYGAKYDHFLSNIQRRLSDWSHRLPSNFRYSREALERAFHRGYAGDFVSMHTLHLFSHLRLARSVRHELMAGPLVARSICTAHSHALQLLALVRDIRALSISNPNANHCTTDLMSPFIAYAITSAIDTLGAGGLREEIVATKQVLSTSIEVLSELSQYCSNARIQLRKAEKRLAQIDSWPAELDIRAGRGADGRCWRIKEPMEKTPSLRQDVMYGVPSSTFAEALTEGRKR